MTAAELTPISAFDEAEKQAGAAALAMLPLIATTVHAQFPTATWLVLTRHCTDYDGDALELDSVRNDQSDIVWSEDGQPLGDVARFPNPVPAEIAALWGTYDPHTPSAVLHLIYRIDQYEKLSFIPGHVMQPEEANAERTPVGIPLLPACSICGDQDCTDRAAQPGAFCAACGYTHALHRFVECAAFTSGP